MQRLPRNLTKRSGPHEICQTASDGPSHPSPPPAAPRSGATSDEIAAFRARWSGRDPGPVLSLCDRSGIMCRPWAAAGFQATAVDIEADEGIDEYGVRHVRADIRDYQPEWSLYAAAFAFPPCTHLAVSGARWFVDKGLQPLIDALTLVEASRAILERITPFWMLENPISTLSTYWRKPDIRFDPNDYGGWINGDRYTKRTCLWVSVLFRDPLPSWVPPVEGSKMHKTPPGPNRATIRSQTPEGFAVATWLANAERAATYYEAAIRSTPPWMPVTK